MHFSWRMTDQAKASHRVQITSRKVRRTSGVGSDVEYSWQIIRTGVGNPIASSTTCYGTHLEASEAGKAWLEARDKLNSAPKKRRT